MAMTFYQELDDLRARVAALEAKYETMRLATTALTTTQLEWGNDVENLKRRSVQHLLRIERLEAGATCPHIISSHGGTSYCDLALQTAAAQLDPIDEEENDRRFKAAMAAIDAATPLSQPVTDHRLISPPAETIRQWEAEWNNSGSAHCDAVLYVAAKAATWAAKLAIEQALRDTASCHWRVADGDEEGVQLVRASDLMAWAAAISKRYGFEE